jgi:hypothetical protein
MGDGMDAMRPIGEPNDSVSCGGLHKTTFEHSIAEAKLKELACLPGIRQERGGAREDASPP